MKNLLFFKHWHLFLLIFICGAWTSPSPLKEIINSVAVLTFTLWIYAIGVYGQDRIAQLGLNSMNVKLFKANVIIVGVLCLVGLIYSATQGQVNEVNSVTNVYKLKDIIFVAAGLYLFFAAFQTIFFACKTIAKIELLREVSLGDYFTNVLLMMFLFAGVWILQPKVNRIIAREEQKAAY